MVDANIGMLYLASACTQAAALGMLIIDLCIRRDASSYSFWSICLSAVGIFSRMRAMQGGAYIPLDPHGGSLFMNSQIFIIIELMILIPLMLRCGITQEAVCGWQVISVVVALACVAYVLHPDLDEIFDHLNRMWSFGKYIEVIDMWPFVAKAVAKPTIPTVAANYVLCMFMSRVFVSLVFFTCYEEFHNDKNSCVGYGLFFSHVVQLLICVDIPVHYFKFFGKDPEIMLREGITLNFVDY